MQKNASLVAVVIFLVAVSLGMHASLKRHIESRADLASGVVRGMSSDGRSLVILTPQGGELFIDVTRRPRLVDEEGRQVAIESVERGTSVKASGRRDGTSFAPGVLQIVSRPRPSDGSALPCPGRVSIARSGSTCRMAPSSVIAVTLPYESHDGSLLRVEPRGAMRETFGLGSEPGSWTRAFETVATGTAVVTVPSRRRSDKPFVMTIVVRGAGGADD